MTMKDNYYFGNPQIFKMPTYFRTPGPPLTPSVVAPTEHALGAFKEGTVARALPYIAVGIAAFVGYNIFIRKRK